MPPLDIVPFYNSHDIFPALLAGLVTGSTMARDSKKPCRHLKGGSPWRALYRLFAADVLLLYSTVARIGCVIKWAGYKILSNNNNNNRSYPEQNIAAILILDISTVLLLLLVLSVLVPRATLIGETHHLAGYCTSRREVIRCSLQSCNNEHHEEFSAPFFLLPVVLIVS